MMRRTLLQRVGLLVPALAQAREAVWLRIRNDSPQPFEHVWLGLPRQGTDVDLGPVPPGQTSRWHAFPAAPPHYRKTRVQLAGRHVTGVLQDGGLLPGSYTFVCTIAPHDGGLRVVAVREH